MGKYIPTEDLLTEIYGMWELVSEPEQAEVNSIDDKFNTKGFISPKETAYLRKLIKSLRSRAERD